jgi:hypothetical protein
MFTKLEVETLGARRFAKFSRLHFHVTVVRVDILIIIIINPMYLLFLCVLAWPVSLQKAIL